MSFERLHPSTAATVTKTKQRPSLLPLAYREVRRVDSRTAAKDDRPFNKLTFHTTFGSGNRQGVDEHGVPCDELANNLAEEAGPPKRRRWDPCLTRCDIKIRQTIYRNRRRFEQ
ncbi:hypothetical protein RBWH47_02993 [Rhodopirellula baltica WH47]|uniref:Uncharacterized protein n=1 Tax=Rhodopirellula baltica WH47 TaxID=991778 RepID=F2AUQ5_RHOBT|nr:hypothetical protein RBWH47_02993 [Rhodopirellula baltica WH47]